MGVMYRVKSKTDRKATEWCLKIVSKAAMGKTVKDNIDELQEFLEHNPVSSPLETGIEAETKVKCSMPKPVPLEK